MQSERLIDIDAKQLRLINSILHQNIPDKTVWAYGSRVNWRAEESSDLDLAVFDCDDKQIWQLKEAFDESDVLISVDVMDWESIPDDFKRNIKRKYVVVQKKGGMGKVSGWREVRLGDVCEVNPLERIGKGQKAKKVNMDALIPFTKKIPKYDIAEYKGGSRYRNGDTLFARITPCLENGKTAFVDFLESNEIGFGSTEFIVLREKTGITDKNFIYYLAISKHLRETAIKSMTGTSGRQRAETDKVRDYKFNLPPLPEQKAIAEVLSSIDDKIDLLHRQNKTLESMAQLIFRKRFIDEAKNSWNRIYLKDIYRFEKGIEPGSKNYQEKASADSIRFIRVGDMQNTTASIHIDTELATRTCDKTDLLVSFDGTVGKVMFGLSGAYSSGIRKIKSTNTTYDSLEFKYLLFKTAKIQSTIQAHAEGTVILHAGSSIQALSFRLPESDKIEQFNRLVKPNFDKILANQAQIRMLSGIRGGLLPKLRNGSITIKHTGGES